MRNPRGITRAALALLGIAVGLGTVQWATTPHPERRLARTDVAIPAAEAEHGEEASPTDATAAGAGRGVGRYAAAPGAGAPAQTPTGPASTGSPEDGMWPRSGEPLHARAEAESDSTHEEEPLPVTRAIELWSGVRATGTLLHGVSGHDPNGPRLLSLWQLDPETGHAAVVAHGHSRSDGSLSFDRLLLPAAAHGLVASPRGVPFDAHPASEALVVSARSLPPPQVHARAREGDLEWRIEARLAPGADLWLSESSRLEPVRFEGAPRRRLERVRWPALRPGETLLAAQQRPGGARSAWVEVGRSPVDRPARSEANEGRDALSLRASASNFIATIDTEE